ncbi:MAG TPA: DALR anticodon-binding domain-containing protein [Candidatus Kapabacteria bacterium]|nr:DALR anticodon-binding domain-containing protein [Candidatus Kapabacteria bacterium]
MLRSRLLPVIEEALRAVGAPEGVRIVLEYPRGESRWDLATPVAFALAARIGAGIDTPPHDRTQAHARPANASQSDTLPGATPMELARAIAAALPHEEAGIEEIAVAPPGFINLRLSPSFWHDCLRAVLAATGNGSAHREPVTAGRAEITLVLPHGRGGNVPGSSTELPELDTLPLAHARTMLLGMAMHRLLELTGWECGLGMAEASHGDAPAVHVHRAGPDGIAENTIRPNVHVAAVENGTAASITFGDLVREIGEAARWVLLDCHPSLPITIDLAEARTQSERVPARYAAYAHARAAGVLRHAAAEGIAVERSAPLEPLRSDTEIRLIGQIAQWDDLLERAAETLAPEMIPEYLHRLAAALNRFLVECRILPEAPPLRAARLALLAGAAETMARGLGIVLPDAGR